MMKSLVIRALMRRGREYIHPHWIRAKQANYSSRSQRVVPIDAHVDSRPPLVGDGITDIDSVLETTGTPPARSPSTAKRPKCCRILENFWVKSATLLNFASLINVAALLNI